MCSIAFDADTDGQQARIYYGGWQLAMMRRGLVPDDSSKRRFLRDVAELRARGLVHVAQPGRSGSNAVYRILLSVDNLPVSVDDEPP